MPIHAYIVSSAKPRTDECDGKLIFYEDEDEEELEEDEEEEEENDDDIWDTKAKPPKPENKEDDPFSYSWRLMRLAAVKLAKLELQRLVGIAGIEMAGKPLFCSQT